MTSGGRQRAYFSTFFLRLSKPRVTFFVRSLCLTVAAEMSHSLQVQCKHAKVHFVCGICNHLDERKNNTLHIALGKTPRCCSIPSPRGYK